MATKVFKVLVKESFDVKGEYPRSYATKEEALAKAKEYALAGTPQYIAEVTVTDKVTVKDIETLTEVTPL